MITWGSRTKTAMILVALGIVAGCTSSPTPGGQPPKRTATLGSDGSATFDVFPQDDNTALLPDGLRVDIPRGAVSAPGQLTVTPTRSDRDPAGVAHVRRIDLSGTQLTGEAVLSVPVTTAPDPVVVVLDAQGEPEPVAGQRAGDRYVVRARHFSTWLFVDWDNVKAAAVSALDALLAGGADNKQPTCPDEQAARAEGVSVTSSDGKRVMWCLGRWEGALRLKVTNTRGYAVTVEYTPGLSPVRGSQLLDRLPSLSDWLDRPSLPRNKLTLIDAGEALEFSVADSPQLQGVMVQPSVPGYLGTAARYALDTAALVYRPLGLDAGTLSKLELASCAAAAYDKRSVKIGNAGEAANYLTEMLGLAFGCMRGPLEGHMAGSIVSGLVISAFAWLWSGILTAVNGLVAAADTALGPEGYQIRIDLGAREAPIPTVAALAKAGVCPSQARLTGSQRFTHPEWGKVVLVSCLESSGPGLAGAAVVDAGGTVRWKYLGDFYFEFGLHRPAGDASGNFFIDYNPGRYNGIMVIRPASNGIRILHGYDAGESSEPSMYYAELMGPGEDGRFSVKQWHNDCTPDCARGTVTSEIFRWSGTAYVR